MTTPARTDAPAGPIDDDSIPLLTERLTLPALDLDFALPTLEQVIRAEPPAAVAPPPPAPPPPSVDELRAAVLKEVLERLPAEIEQRIRAELRPALDAAIEQFSAQADRLLRETLADIVTRAVREALDAAGDRRP